MLNFAGTFPFPLYYFNTHKNSELIEMDFKHNFPKHFFRRPPSG